MRGGNDGEVGLAIPQECVEWCRAQDYDVMVSDDMARVDLDWWNTRLQRHAIPARIVGRDADGLLTDHGVGYLRRADLAHDPNGDPITDACGVPRPTDLSALYRAAGWLSAHPHRDRRRRFPDVATPAPPRREFDAITTTLAACRHTPWQVIPDATVRRRWSGWPQAPGAGSTVVSLYLWATHHHTGSAGASAVATTVGPQLLDQQAVASLIHLGWTEEPVAASFTWARYVRYCTLLHTWAVAADVPAELIEMWLTLRWRKRTAHHTYTR